MKSALYVPVVLLLLLSTRLSVGQDEGAPPPADSRSSVEWEKEKPLEGEDGGDPPLLRNVDFEGYTIFRGLNPDYLEKLPFWGVLKIVSELLWYLNFVLFFAAFVADHYFKGRFSWCCKVGAGLALSTALILSEMPFSIALAMGGVPMFYSLVSPWWYYWVGGTALWLLVAVYVVNKQSPGWTFFMVGAVFILCLWGSIKIGRYFVAGIVVSWANNEEAPSYEDFQSGIGLSSLSKLWGGDKGADGEEDSEGETASGSWWPPRASEAKGKAKKGKAKGKAKKGKAKAKAKKGKAKGKGKKGKAKAKAKGKAKRKTKG